MKLVQVFSVVFLISAQSIYGAQVKCKMQEAQMQEVVGVYNTLEGQDSSHNAEKVFKQEQEFLRISLILNNEKVRAAIDILSLDPACDEDFKDVLRKNLLEAEEAFNKSSEERMQKSRSWWDKVWNGRKSLVSRVVKEFHVNDKKEAVGFIKDAFIKAIAFSDNKEEVLKKYVSDDVFENIRVALFEANNSLIVKKPASFSALKWGGATLAVVLITVAFIFRKQLPKLPCLTFTKA